MFKWLWSKDGSHIPRVCIFPGVEKMKHPSQNGCADMIFTHCVSNRALYLSCNFCCWDLANKIFKCILLRETFIFWFSWRWIFLFGIQLINWSAMIKVVAWHQTRNKLLSGPTSYMWKIDYCKKISQFHSWFSKHEKYENKRQITRPDFMQVNIKYHYAYELDQWEQALPCNTFSHWLCL